MSMLDAYDYVSTSIYVMSVVLAAASKYDPESILRQDSFFFSVFVFFAAPVHQQLITLIMKDAEIVGASLAEVLPHTGKYWFQQSHLLRLNLILLIPLLSSSVSGYDGSLMNGLQSLETWREYFGHPEGAMLGLVNAAQSIGSVASIPFIGNLADRYGRKPVLLAGIIMIIVATVIQASSFSFAQFVVSRFLVGFGGMFVVQPSPMLIAELAYPTHRGKYTSAFWTMYYLGAILASWTTFGTQTYTSNWSWRIPSIIQAALPCVQLAFIWAVPESPRWLIAHGRTPEAAAILSKYHSGQTAPEEGFSPLVTRELSEIVHAIELENMKESVGWKALISSPGNRKRTLIAVLIGAMAQWNGIGIVSYYLTLVLNTIGITATHTQTLINGLLQVFNFIASVAAAFLVDRLGRRTLFLWSSAGMLVSYVVWTACSALVSENGNNAAGIVVVVCLFIYYFHYDIAWTPLLFGYTTEIFPYSLRSKGIALELLSIYSSLIVAAFCNPIGMENLGWKYYIVYCCLLVVFLFIVFFLFPETKGHSLEEIAALFDGDDARISDDARDDKGVVLKASGVGGTADHTESA
ncbi:Uu.00g104580.m01.CDS01 [Anthostomella pinea]|uniref:Uu.00g104580.m01.CDS01 n=1 Tax=Anthostomella pinea TaxID=933095 RepID=A0AAI8VE98_9PEZI|nr:Uu.00g104580.m01.CDS01 [Anthostomella pinea]